MTTGVSSKASDPAEQAAADAVVDDYAAGTPDGLPEPAMSRDDVEYGALPEGYADIRGNSDIQFSPIAPKELKPREPSWLERQLGELFEWLTDQLSPIGELLGMNWTVFRWVLIAIGVIVAIYAMVRLIGPIVLQRRNAAAATGDAEQGWQPDRHESLALLEDADRLAQEGRFEEAARLLLQRSVGQIAAARPDWVDPSSTARELSALPALSEAARRAFAVISEAVERSLFALKQLSRDDWETARAAYTDFALARIDAHGDADNVEESRMRTDH